MEHFSGTVQNFKQLQIKEEDNGASPSMSKQNQTRHDEVISILSDKCTPQKSEIDGVHNMKNDAVSEGFSIGISDPRPLAVQSEVHRLMHQIYILQQERRFALEKARKARDEIARLKSTVSALQAELKTENVTIASEKGVFPEKSSESILRELLQRVPDYTHNQERSSSELSHCPWGSRISLQHIDVPHSNDGKQKQSRTLEFHLTPVLTNSTGSSEIEPTTLQEICASNENSNSSFSQVEEISVGTGSPSEDTSKEKTLSENCKHGNTPFAMDACGENNITALGLKKESEESKDDEGSKLNRSSIQPIRHFNKSKYLEKISPSGSCQAIQNESSSLYSKHDGCEYRCKTCGKQFRTVLTAIRHVQHVHLNSRPFKCDVCGYRFYQESELVAHKKIHVKTKDYACHICGKMFLSKDSQILHLKSHRGEKAFACDVCGKRFIRNSKLLQHREIHFKPKKVHICEVCGQQFNTKSKLNAHKLDHNFKCNYCARTYVSEGELNEHMTIHLKNVKCNICFKSFSSKYSLKNHDCDCERQRSHSCDLCGKCYRNRYNLVGHILLHLSLPSLTVKCPLCEKVFAHKGLLQSHSCPSKVKLNGTECVCDICGKVFPSKKNLEAHRARHTDQKIHKCGVCGKGFAVKADIIRHKKIHSNVKKFHCDICGKRFKRCDNFKNHKLVMHSGERPFCCEICGARFTNSRYLRYHLSKGAHKCSSNRIIRPIRCNVCGKEFKYMYQLKRHEPVHSTEKRHQCDVCGHKVKYRQSLLEHKKIVHAQRKEHLNTPQ